MSTEHERGEWWIDEDGQSVYADGDIGDMNHEGLVIQRVLCSLADKMGVYDYDDGDWDYIRDKVTKKYLEDHPELEDQEIDTDKLFMMLLMINGVDTEIISLAQGNGDARQYAAENWGWKHVNDDSVNTWTLTPDDADIILSGLWDIHGELEPDDEFEIYVHTTEESYTLTIAQLEHMANGSTQILRQNLLNFDLANQAALAYGIFHDKHEMHPCYKNRIGD